jgi:hypothetical protein
MPTPAPTLTGLEQICRGLGIMAFHIADARDKGMLLTDVLILLRKTAIADDQINQFLEQVNSAMIYDFYGASAHVTPAQGQRLLETLCVTQGLGAVLRLYAIQVTSPAMVR